MQHAAWHLLLSTVMRTGAATCLLTKSGSDSTRIRISTTTLCGHMTKRKFRYEVMQGGPALFVWAGMSVHGVTPLHVIHGSLNADGYQTILQNQLLPVAQQWFPDGHWRLLQDGARPHAAKSTQAWLDQQLISHVPASDWPPNSPDLNPIENIWGWAQSQLQGRKVRTSSGMLRVLNEIWNSAPKSMLQATIHSMPDRLKAVRKNKGRAIKQY
jgi:hypothetical protein